MFRDGISFDTVNKYEELESLKRRTEYSKNKLLEILEESHILKTVTIPQLNHYYQALLGEAEKELRYKSKNLSDLHILDNNLSFRVRSGIKINSTTKELIENLLNNKTGSFHEELNNISSLMDRQPVEKNLINFQFFSKIRNFDDFNQNSFNSKFIKHSYKTIFKNNDSKNEIKKIYSSIVKKLHPDVSIKTDYFERFWIPIQNAYQNRDISSLNLYYLVFCYEDSCNQSFATNEIVFFNHKIKEFEFHIFNEKLKINNLKSQEPYSIRLNLQDNIWVNTRKLSIKSKMLKIDKEIKHLKTSIKEKIQLLLN